MGFGNLCSHLSCLVRDASFDMVAVGDTLYVANWEALLKFPLKDLEKPFRIRNPIRRLNKV